MGSYGSLLERETHPAWGGDMSHMGDMGDMGDTGDMGDLGNKKG